MTAPHEVPFHLEKVNHWGSSSSQMDPNGVKTKNKPPENKR
jgi:hypothetical protein